MLSAVQSWLRPKDAIYGDSYSRLMTKIREARDNPALVEHEEHETALHHLLMPHPDKGQPDIPSEKVLWEEAGNLIAGGSETVATVINVGVFHVLNNPAVHERLVEELKRAWPELEMTMRYETLEKLPYLVRGYYCTSSARGIQSDCSQTAVIKESLRKAHGVVHPLPRVVGPTDATIAGFTVPAGVRGALAWVRRPDADPLGL